MVISGVGDTTGLSGTSTFENLNGIQLPPHRTTGQKSLCPCWAIQ